MKTLFKPLFRVRFRHTFYKDGRCSETFNVYPSAGCLILLNGYGLVLHHEGDGFAVYAEVNAEGSDDMLLRSVGDDTLRFVFLLQSKTAAILNVSDLPDHRPGQDVFYFSNLRDDHEDDRLYLGDNIANARVGDPIRLVYSSVFSFRFNSPVNSASFILKDLFGNIIHRHSFRLPDPAEKLEEYRLDLSNIDNLLPGRYEITDNHGKTERFYFIPSQFGKDVFGIIELFNKTNALTPGNNDLVPAAYKFLDGDTLAGDITYTIQFEHRKTTWLYIIEKKYKLNDITLEGLKISSDVAFNKSLPDEKAIFISAVAVPLKEEQKKIILQHNDKDIRKLPNPSLNTPLKKGGGPNSFESHMYIFV